MDGVLNLDRCPGTRCTNGLGSVWEPGRIFRTEGDSLLRAGQGGGRRPDLRALCKTECPEPVATQTRRMREREEQGQPQVPCGSFGRC